MSTHRLLYLSRQDVMDTGVSMAEIIGLLDDVFRQAANEQTELPPKIGIHPGGGDNFIHAMPAYVPGMKAAGIKWVSGFPNNVSLDLPYVNGLIVLNDTENGLPLMVMDCIWLTGMRTGAATALSARFLARPDASVVGVLGCGLQGRTNLEALDVDFPIVKVKAYDINHAAAAAYAAEMASRFDVEIEVVDTPQQAVTGCDIVVTAGPILKEPHATIQPGWMSDGAFASLVDFDAYWHPDAMAQVDKFCTDDTAQMDRFRQMGYFKSVPPLYADLGQMVIGQKSGRQNPDEKTMAANLGVAIEDMAVAPLIFKRAKAQGIGTWLDL